MNNHVHPPVGLGPLVSRIEAICASAAGFRRCGAKPDHYLLNLDVGNGQTKVAEYVSSAFRTYGIRHFGGLDDFLEYHLDGTMVQLKQVLGDIKNCAIYTNAYEGVVAMDISGLAAHLNEAQTALFLKELPAIGEHATLLLFVPTRINRNMALLVDKVCAVLGNQLKVLQLPPYTEENLVEIIKGLLEEAGVNLEDDGNLDECLLSAVRSAGAVTVSDAKQLVQLLVKNADFEQFIPVLDSGRIRAVFDTSMTREAK